MARRDGLLAVYEEGSEFGLRCGGYDVFDDLGDGVDGTVVWRVSVIAQHEEMAADPAGGFQLREVGDIAVVDENHIACSIRDDGIGVCGGVVKRVSP